MNFHKKKKDEVCFLKVFLKSDTKSSSDIPLIFKNIKYCSDF